VVESTVPASRVDGRRLPGAEPLGDRVTVVVITFNRCAELLRTLARLAALPQRPPVMVVDNASTDATTEAVTRLYPWVTLITADRNLGAVGRNVAVERVTTRFVAFCDDDTWWAPGSLERAADTLDAHPRVASVTARIIVEPTGREDAIVAELRGSPVPGPPELPGPALVSILAGASMLRVRAFRQVGGFSERLWLGGEEELLSVDLATAGWYLCYLDDVVVHHHPSPVREADLRRRHGIRNTLWFTWLRRPWGRALRRSFLLARSVPRDRVSMAGFLEAVAGLPWVVRERRVLPPRVEDGLRLVEDSQLRTGSRRYVSAPGTASVPTPPVDAPP
jgi:GT2 family glycosyltransferase